MSRTVRRKGGRKPFWYPDYVLELVDGIWTWTRGEGPEHEKALKRYHADRDYHDTAPAWWRRMHWQEFRAQARQEITRYCKNEEHEVQIRNNPRWEWWD